MFEERRNHVIKQCTLEGRVSMKYSLRHSLPLGSIFEVNQNILYCPILKVGSTFWQHTLAALSSNGSHTSPFDGVRSRAPNIIRVKKRTLAGSDVGNALKTVISFMVVRDPYTKLFSGYADKLFHPNYLFWRLLGQKVQTRTRKLGDLQAEFLCGHNVTFAEYLKYIIDTYAYKEKLNRHFMTLHEQCDPCEIEFDYILKLESFKDDTLFLLNVLQKRFHTQINFEHFEKETAIDNAKQHIRISFITKRQYSAKCNLTAYSFLFRTWRFLQISGVIPISAKMPMETEADAHLITEDLFLQMISGVIAKISDWDTVRLQRKDAFFQAYQSVEIEDLEKLRKIMEPDCRYFGYDCSIKSLLSNKQYTNFDYFDVFSGK